MEITPLVHHKLLTPEDSKHIRARSMVLMPGEEAGEHSSQGHEEVLIIVDGDATVMVGTEDARVSSGNSVYIPPHTSHNVLNKSNAPVGYVYIRSR